MRTNQNRLDLFGWASQDPKIVVENHWRTEDAAHNCSAPQIPPNKKMDSTTVCEHYTFDHGWAADTRTTYLLCIREANYLELSVGRAYPGVNVTIAASNEMRMSHVQWELNVRVDIGASRQVEHLGRSADDRSVTPAQLPHSTTTIMLANQNRHDLFGLSEQQQVVIVPNRLAAKGRHLCNALQKLAAENIVVNKKVCGQYRFQHGWSASLQVLYKLKIGNNKHFHVENFKVADKLHVSLGVSPEMKLDGLEWELYVEVDVGGGRNVDVLINSKIDNG